MGVFVISSIGGPLGLCSSQFLRMAASSDQAVAQASAKAPAARRRRARANVFMAVSVTRSRAQGA